MASPQARIIEIDQSYRLSKYMGAYGLIIGNFDKGPTDDRILITDGQMADTVLGRPRVGSDDAYYILYGFLEKSRKAWVRRVVGAGALYGGVNIPAAYLTQLGTGDGITTTFTGTLDPGRLPENAVIEVFVGNSKWGYGVGAHGSTTITIDGTYINNAVSQVDVTNGNITITFDSPLPSGAVLRVRWASTVQTSWVTGQANPDTYNFIYPNDTFDATQLGNYEHYELQHVAGVYNDIVVPAPLYAPATVANENESSVLIVDGSTVIAYADATGTLVDVGGGHIDTTQPHQVSFVDGTITFTLDGAYTPASPLQVYYKTVSAWCCAIYGDNVGSWASDYAPTIYKIDFTQGYCYLGLRERQGGRWLLIQQNITISRDPALVDGNGYLTYIEDRLNGNSYYMRAVDNPDVNQAVLPFLSIQANTINDPLITPMMGGDNGAAPTVADYITALQSFDNPEDVQIDLVIDTLGEVDYQQAIIDFCDPDLGGRGDCYGILYVPFDVEQSNNYVNDAIDYRNYQLNRSSSWAGLYFGFVEIYDTYNGRVIYIPPSGHVAAVFSYTFDISEPWFAAAGWRRGRLPVRDLYRRLRVGERDAMYDNDINCMRFKPGRGIAVWGQKTLYGIASSLDRANVRWLLITVRKSLKDILDEFEFEFNDTYTRRMLKSIVDGAMESIKTRRGVYDYYTVCDESNNPPEVIDNNEMYIDLYVKPEKVAEYLYGRIIVTRTGVNFSDVILTP